MIVRRGEGVVSTPTPAKIGVRRVTQAAAVGKITGVSIEHSTNQASSSPSFAELGVAAEICRALEERGISHTFAIQELTLPLALDGGDLIGQARTGMGKTLGFGVPLLDRVFDSADIEELDGTPRALIVTPTRELARQVAEDLTQAARYTTVTVGVVYGGTSINEQEKMLKNGCDVVVGTPGRICDLVERNSLVLTKTSILVLDEADEMLDLGFMPQVERILQWLPPVRQTMLFSATMPGPIVTLARSFLNKPMHVTAESGEVNTANEDIEQVIFQSHRMDKLSVIARILCSPDRGRTIIFTRTKRSAAEVAQDMAERGFRVGAVHGDLDQKEREKALSAFRDGTVDVLVATDVAARGIDIDDVTHVINHQVPDDPMTYVHRIGRTGRAGHKGIAATLVGYDELHKWSLINQELGLDLPEPPQWFSNSPELFETFNIPADARGKVGPSRPVVGGNRIVNPARNTRGAKSRQQRLRTPRK